ncbi:MAG: M1 family metallopeptidase, partial [FCB group bacterium]|nr:M1 family metallopeptidase [FCB group bacterium]
TLYIEGDEALEYVIDYSVMTVRLNEPLKPGETCKIRAKFRTKLPSGRIGIRLAYSRGQYKGAYWYPTICCYDRELGWVNNQHLAWGEPYNDFGTYDVSLTLPPQFIVAATGELTNREEVLPDTLRQALDIANFRNANPPDLSYLYEGSPKTWKFHAENVNDFTFAADPEFCIDETEYDGIKIYAYILRRNTEAWYDAAETGRKGIQLFSELFGKYPYPQMSITDSHSGMEYPMLVMCSGRSPSYSLLFWHEIGHNYFMGAVGSNQTDRAFLDEGFTTWLEITAMEHYLGREGNVRRGDYGGPFNWFADKFHPLDEDRVYRGFRPFMHPSIQGYTLPMPLNADSAPEWLIYRASSYYKPVCMFFAMRYMMGEELHRSCIADYFVKWKFKHPYERDFFQSCEETTGMELTWFFEQWVYTDKKLDYALCPPQLIGKDEEGYRYILNVERKGEMLTPLRLHLKLKDDSIRDYWIPLNDNPPPDESYFLLPKWDQLRSPFEEYTAEVILPAKIESLEIDPESLLADLNPLNNRWPHPKIKVDWMVDRKVTPVDAYHLQHRPSINYNETDGVELGWRLDGSYLDYKYKFSLSGDIGTLNGSPDFKFYYATPIDAISPHSFINFNLFTCDGLNGGRAFLSLRRKPFYAGETLSLFRFGWEQMREFDSAYSKFPQTWSKGIDNTIFINGWHKFLSGRRAVIDFSLHTSLFTDDFRYSRWEMNLKDDLPLLAGFRLKTHLSAGMIDGDKVPLQREFYASGWDPIIGRAPSMIPVEGLIPSDNFTRLFTQTRAGAAALALEDPRFSSDTHAAFAAELLLPMNLRKRVWIPFYGSLNMALTPSVFSGVNLAVDNPEENEDIYWNFGPGINLTGIPGGEFKLLFPIYLNPALSGEDRLEFRWIIAFVPQSLFM